MTFFSLSILQSHQTRANFVDWQDNPNRKCRAPEVVAPILLTKTAPGYEADSSLLQQLHAVKHIWLLTFFLKEKNENIIPHIGAWYSADMGTTLTWSNTALFLVSAGLLRASALVYVQRVPVTHHASLIQTLSVLYCNIITEHLWALFFSLPLLSIFLYDLNKYMNQSRDCCFATKGAVCIFCIYTQ